MKIITTLSALLFTACTIPGLKTGSTLPPTTPSPAAPAASPAPGASPAAEAPASASVADAPTPNAAPAVAKEDVDVIDDAAQWLAEIHSGKLVPGHGTRESELRDRAMFCSQRVANLLGNGVAKSTALPLDNAQATLGSADLDICQALRTAADGWDMRGKQAYAAQNDALLEPYRKAGVSGDKLKLVGDLGKQLIGPDHAEATPEIVARASVLFSLRDEGARLDGGHNYTIVRYAFRGNAQVAVTEKAFHAHPAADQFR